MSTAAIAVALWRLQEPVDPEVVDGEVRRVMSERRFSYEPSLLERIGDWLAERVDLPGLGGGGTFGGGAGAWVAWLIIAVAAVLVVVAVVQAVRGRPSKAGDDGPATEAEVEHRRRAGEWASDAERFEAEGRWKDAVRARYRELVRTLVDRRQLPDVPGRTTGELRRDLATTTPDAADAFDTACLVFELAWYADVPVGPEQLQRLRAAATAVLGADVLQRWDGGASASAGASAAATTARVGGGS